MDQFKYRELPNRSPERLVKLCHDHGVELCQSYAQVGPRGLARASRYALARQSRRMRRQIRKLHTFLGRAVCDIERKISDDVRLQQIFADELVSFYVAQ